MENGRQRTATSDNAMKLRKYYLTNLFFTYIQMNVFAMIDHQVAILI